MPEHTRRRFLQVSLAGLTAGLGGCGMPGEGEENEGGGEGGDETEGGEGEAGGGGEQDG